MMRFFEMFSKRVVKIAGKCGPIKRIKANQLERIGELVPRVSLKIQKKINFLSCKSNGERKLLSNQCNNNNDIIKLYLHGYICSYSIAKALRLSYNLY